MEPTRGRHRHRGRARVRSLLDGLSGDRLSKHLRASVSTQERRRRLKSHLECFPQSRLMKDSMLSRALDEDPGLSTVIHRVGHSRSSIYAAFDGSSPTIPQDQSSAMLSSTPHTSLSYDSLRTMLRGPRSREATARQSLATVHEALPTLGQPSIRTVEAAASVKIHLEIYYNALLNCQLTHCPSTSRKARVLNSVRGRASFAYLAGYEAIRVLGKGSFGVVRLVRATRDRTPSEESSGSIVRRPPLETEDGACMEETGYRFEVEHVPNVFAMKVIRKSDMLKNSQEGHLRAERDFLVAARRSSWVVPLLCAFQDDRNLYLVMEYMIGGDFLGHLIEAGMLDEQSTQFYVAEMLLCLEETHRLQWIHRDVKPDNFLISSTGHLKISDFGLAFDGHWIHNQKFYNSHRHSLLERLGIEVQGDGQDIEDAVNKGNAKPTTCAERSKSSDSPAPASPENNIIDHRNACERRRLARSVVGTSQYMAPEVIRGEPYDGRCDFWSLGIIMYECLYGETPFVEADRHQTKLNILMHDKLLKFPHNRDRTRKYHVSKEARHLMRSLICERQYRLSSPHYHDHVEVESFVYANDAADIKLHPFFYGINFETLAYSVPPDVPKVRNQSDTRYFDREPTVSDNDAESIEDSQDDFVHGKGKDRKRPRDKILRDPETGPAALKMRKAAAFMGYTYVRPSGP